MGNDAPPSYANAFIAASPPYSPTASQTESVVTVSPDQPPSRPSSNQQWLYKSDNIVVDLGQNIWDTHLPSFGLNGIVEGSIRLVCPLEQVAKLSIALEGHVMATFTERGNIVGLTKAPLISSISSEWTCCEIGSCDSQHIFSLPFPTYAAQRSTVLPPSTSVYLPGTICEVGYRLRVELTRKGLRRHNSLKIPVLYLPKSYSQREPLYTMPMALTDPSNFTPSCALGDDVEVTQVFPTWCTPVKQPLANDIPEIFVATPRNLNYASSEQIPLAIKIRSLQAPALVRLLAANLQVSFLRRTLCKMDGKRLRNIQEYPCGSAEVTHIDDSVEGLSVLFFVLQCRQGYAQVSWQVEGIAEQMHFFRVKISPPPNIASSLPKFEFEKSVRIASDVFPNDFEQLDFPVPAIQLMSRPQPPHAHRRDTV